MRSGQSILSGKILTPDGWLRGVVTIVDGRVAQLRAESAAPATRLLLPGFIDLHVHGGGGADVMSGAAALHTTAKTHARFGTTAFLATTMTAPIDALGAVLAQLAEAIAAPRPDGAARVLGVHLEGPFISPDRLGAQPPPAVDASLDTLLRLQRSAPLRVVTLAPEAAAARGVIEALVERGVRVQIGHSAASYEDTVATLARGAHGFTHLFNAMSGLHHRQPGVVGAALAHAQFAELIPDLLHVHSGAILAALRAIPKLYAVTDATAAAGMPDGDYRLGTQPVFKCLGCVRLADGTLAGSALTTDRAFANLVSIGLSIEDASRRLSTFPAEYLGLVDRGRIAVGTHADLVVLDEQLGLREVFVEGERIRGVGPAQP